MCNRHPQGRTRKLLRRRVSRLRCSPLGGATVERATFFRESGILVTLVFLSGGRASTQIRDGDVGGRDSDVGG